MTRSHSGEAGATSRQSILLHKRGLLTGRILSTAISAFFRAHLIGIRLRQVIQTMAVPDTRSPILDSQDPAARRSPVSYQRGSALKRCLPPGQSGRRSSYGNGACDSICYAVIAASVDTRVSRLWRGKPLLDASQIEDLVAYLQTLR